MDVVTGEVLKGLRRYGLLWSSIFVTLVAKKILLFWKQIVYYHTCFCLGYGMRSYISCKACWRTAQAARA